MINRKKVIISKVYLICSVSFLGLMCPSIVRAQTSGAATLSSATNDQQAIPDIVVTASKRSERSQDVPITISAISGDDLKARGVLDAVSLAKEIPGLDVALTSGYGDKLNYTLRGVGLNNFSEVQEAAVAVYQDEVYIASPIGAQFSLFDIDRVEVLSGPQGSLFGRSASGGLISYVSKSPGTSWNGYLTTGGGSYGERLVEGAQDMPLDNSGDNAIRASFSYHGTDGFLHDETTGRDLEGGDRYAGRMQIRLQPASGLQILFKGEYGEFDSDHAVGFTHVNSYVDSSGASQLVGNKNIYGTPGGDLFGYRDTSSNYWSTQAGTSGLTYSKRTLLDNRITWDLGSVTLTSVTGYVDYNERYMEDTDGTAINYIAYHIQNHSTETQQELRLSSNPGSDIRWTFGGFYFNYDVHYDTNAQFPTGIAPFGITTPFGEDSVADQHRHSFAGYGQFEVPLASELSLVVGGRAEREHADFTYHQLFNPLALTTAVLGAAPVNFSPSLDGDLATIEKTYLSGDATLNYRPDDNVLLYTSLKRGIKPGGFSTPIEAIDANKMKYAEEKPLALEGGVKSDLLDHKLRFNASIYHYWYNDYQAVQYKDTQTYTGNATARVDGVDTEIVWAPIKSTKFGVSGSYVDAVAKGIPLVGNGGIDIRDRTLPNAPKISLNPYASYQTDLAEGVASLRLDMIYRGKTYFEIQNNPALEQGAYHTVDVSAGWTNGDWTMSLTASNILNAKYAAFVQDYSSFGFVDRTPGRPRWVTFQLTREW